MERLADTLFVKAVVPAGNIVDHELEPVFDEVDWSGVDIIT
jgi:hypothetical protein